MEAALSQLQDIQTLVKALRANPDVLRYAQNVATAIVPGPRFHCAATLSSLLVFAGIFPNGGGTGSGDLEPWVPSLAYDLEQRRGWVRLPVDSELQPGDVGVVMVDEKTHHIYLIVDTDNQANPLIADNQETVLHPRAIAGSQIPDYAPTSYILRAG
jgi:hypothetical protein